MSIGCRLIAEVPLFGMLDPVDRRGGPSYLGMWGRISTGAEEKDLLRFLTTEVGRGWFLSLPLIKPNQLRWSSR